MPVLLCPLLRTCVSASTLKNAQRRRYRTTTTCTQWQAYLRPANGKLSSSCSKHPVASWPLTLPCWMATRWVCATCSPDPRPTVGSYPPPHEPPLAGVDHDYQGLLFPSVPLVNVLVSPRESVCFPAEHADGTGSAQPAGQPLDRCRGLHS
ncbi:hypothetical protein VTI74DRAFT_424 [Chaetomium olivicolor]